jgi:hypothetical protein
LIELLVPVITSAALATIWPLNAFKVDTTGWLTPVGHVVRYWSNPDGTTVIFSEYAAVLAGNPHDPDDSGNDLVVPPLRIGPPNVPSPGLGEDKQAP